MLIILFLGFRMFAKPYRVKSQSQMKGSDKKKFRQQVKKTFFGDQEEALLDAFLPQKEEMTVTKIYTFGGESVLVYTVSRDPLFFELDKAKTLYPTVYMMW